MARVQLTDGSGKWFNEDSAIHFKEGTRWDGRNHVGLITKDQFHHQELYYTKSGNWVLHEWSNWQGSAPEYTLIELDAAAHWLITSEYFDGNQYDNIDALPKAVLEEILNRVQTSEV